MKIFPLTSENLNHYKNRLQSLQPNAKPRWGTMNPSSMLKHLSTSMDLANGSLPFRDQSSFFSRFILKYVFIYANAPFPKGIKAPDFYSPLPDHTIEDEKAILLKKWEDFFKELENNPAHRIRHPFFGMMSLKQWGVIFGKHIHHHFNQFGV